MAIHQKSSKFFSSGDGSNRRFSAVSAYFERKECCANDTIFCDGTLQQHWWQTFQFLTLVRQAGIVLNPDKFRFAERSVDLADFCIFKSAVEPLPKYLNAIKNFTSPKTSQDI